MFTHRLNEAIRFRRSFGLRSDPAYVGQLLRSMLRGGKLTNLVLTKGERRLFVRRVAQARVVRTFVQAALREYPSTFGGAFIDQAAGGRVTIGFVGTSATTNRVAHIALERLPGVAVTIRRVRYSWAYLQRESKSLLLVLLRHEAAGVRAVYPDPRSDRVAVVAGRPSRALGALPMSIRGAVRITRAVGTRSSSAGLTNVRLRPQSSRRARTAASDPFGPLPVPINPSLGGTVINPVPPMWAALPLQPPDTSPTSANGGACESGFAAYSKTSSAYYLLTDDACADVGQTVSYRSQAIGTVAARPPVIDWYQEYFSDGTIQTIPAYDDEAELVNLPAVDRSRLLWFSSTDQFGQYGTEILNEEPAGGEVVGQPICASLPEEDLECSTVDTVGFNALCSGCHIVNGQASDEVLLDQVVTDITESPGDVASPVFLGNTAYGFSETAYGAVAGIGGLLTYSPIAYTDYNQNTGVYTGRSGVDDLAAYYAPQLRYDARENYYAASAAEATDNFVPAQSPSVPADVNSLKDSAGNVIVTSDPSNPDHLSLGYLNEGTYADGHPASSSDYID